MDIISTLMYIWLSTMHIFYTCFFNKKNTLFVQNKNTNKHLAWQRQTVRDDFESVKQVGYIWYNNVILTFCPKYNRENVFILFVFPKSKLTVFSIKDCLLAICQLEIWVTHAEHQFNMGLMRFIYNNANSRLYNRKSWPDMCYIHPNSLIFH